MDKEIFLKKLKKLNINKKEFSFLCKVPYSTINNWGTIVNEKPLAIPGWVEPFLLYYDKAQKLDYVTDEICEKIRDAKIWIGISKSIPYRKLKHKKALFKRLLESIE